MKIATSSNKGNPRIPLKRVLEDPEEEEEGDEGVEAEISLRYCVAAIDENIVLMKTKIQKSDTVRG